MDQINAPNGLASSRMRLKCKQKSGRIGWPTANILPVAEIKRCLHFFFYSPDLKEMLLTNDIVLGHNRSYEVETDSLV